jgi:predicted lysophospholipase L1 biosynthesis ABC-type transport system permease subunit
MALSILVVAAAIALVLVFEGFRVGLYAQVRSFPQGLPADLVAAQRGVSNILGARSVLPQSARAEVETVRGVKAAHPLGGMPVIYSRGDESSPIYVVAYDTAGGPRHLVTGHGIAEKDEIVVDAALARKYGFTPGEGVEFLGHTFKIAGLSADGTNFFDPYVFARLEDVVDLYLAGDLPEEVATNAALSFLLIELEPGADRDAVRAEIERKVPSVNVFTPAELGANDVRRAQGFMGPPLNLLVVIAYVVGILLVALTLYASVLARMREFGIMKAIGTPGVRLAGAVTGEALVVSMLALAIGTSIAVGLAHLIRWAMPLYLVDPLELHVLARTTIGTGIMACLGALLPIHRVAAVDPSSVFKQWE